MHKYHLSRPWIIAVILSLGLMLLSTPVLAQGGEWPRTVVDAAGSEITLQAPPTRIASVTIASDEILLSLVEPARLVGVTTLAGDPGISNVAAQAGQIAQQVTADPELLISLEPDLVIVATWTDPAVVDQLREAGLTVFLMPAPVGLEAIAETVRLLGTLVGEEDAANTLADSMIQQIEEIGQAVGNSEPVRALYLTPGNYTSGTPSTISEIIASAGGIDIAADAGVSQFEPLSDEFILEQDPDVILFSGWTPWDPTYVDAFMQNELYAGLTAVRNNRVIITNDAHLTTTSHFVAEGVADVAAILHPGSYPAYPLTLVDVLGREVTLERRPETIASLTLGTDEILAALYADAPEQVIGLSHLVDMAGISNLAGTDLLAAFTQTRVEADPEQLIALNPDLILAATFTDAAVLEQLEAAGLTVVTVGSFTSTAAMLDNVAWLGHILGKRIESQTLIGTLTDRLERVSSAVMMVEEPSRVIYLSTDSWIAGCATTLDDIIRRAGGINAACEAGLMDWKQIDAETLLTLDPDVIVLSTWVDTDAWLADTAIQGLSAVQSGQVIAGNDAHLSAVSQYIVDGVEDMLGILYPHLAG